MAQSDDEQLLEIIATTILEYKSQLAVLERELSSNELQVNGISVAGVYAARLELQRLIALAKAQEANFSPRTSHHKIEEREAELTLEHERLLEKLGNERTGSLLVAALQVYVNSYSFRVSAMARNWAALPTVEYEEFCLAEQLPLALMLMDRDRIALLLEKLPANRGTEDVMRRLLDADRVLRENGVELLGPVLRSGMVRRGRQALFEPRERWWHYLDEVRE